MRISGEPRVCSRCSTALGVERHLASSKKRIGKDLVVWVTMHDKDGTVLFEGDVI